MYTALLKKAEQILHNNLYPPHQYVWGEYRMVSPGKGPFPGIWNWDSAFHAIGMLDFDVEIAKEQILGFLQFQETDGQLPDVIWETGGIANNCTKPPVMAWAAWKVFERCQDIHFLQQVYPALVKNEHFWYEKRWHDGLFHYDADRAAAQNEAQYLQWVGWETGWDNSPRWDSEPQHCWAIDLNCYMVMTYRALGHMAEALGQDSAVWHKRETEVTHNIESRLWNQQLSAYTDYNFEKRKYSSTLTPASFMPLFIGTASPNRAEKMNTIAGEHFLPGMPTVAYTDPTYSRDYWRGPCWLNVAYFAAKGLKNYGFLETAETIRSTILEWVEKDGDCIHENYDATTGEGLCCDHFSWSSVFVREFILRF